MSRIAFVNGAYVPFDQAAVHIEDRGFQFADGIYEAFAVVNGVAIDQPGHWARLERSLAMLGQGLPMPIPALANHVRETIARNRVRQGVAYLQVTRGRARRDHPFPSSSLPQSVVITARRVDRARADAVAAAGIAVHTLPDNRWGRCDIKTTALIANVLAKQSAREAGAYEAWFVDAAGHVTEGASSNAWIVDDSGALVTRPLAHDILGGVTRASVIELARQSNYRVVERGFSVEEAKAAREAFITSAGAFVLPVVTVDGATIGQGAPGPVALALRAAYVAAKVRV